MKRETPQVSATIDNGVLTIETIGQPDIVVDPANLPDAIVAYASLHGFKQKIGDAAALSVVNGVRPTPAMKYAAMMTVWESIQAGIWNRRAEGDGSGSDGLLVRALVEVTEQPADVVRATVKGWSKQEQAAMRLDPSIAPIIERMKREKAPKVDTTPLLTKLRNIGKSAE